jgi:hypothetical protein
MYGFLKPFHPSLGNNLFESIRARRYSNVIVAMASWFLYLVHVNRLTKQEQLVLCIVLGLLLTGWAVKTFRAAHPPAAVTRVAAP